ncbi:MAG: N-acetylmuramoyl-L-alanine amidase family protein [Pseudoflavonifractor sp.]
MKKIALFLALALALVFPAQAAAPNGSIPIELHHETSGRYEPGQADVVALTLDGEPLSAQVPAMVQNSRTLVPVRAVAEPLGATVLWAPETRQVILRKGSSTIVLTLGSATALVNGKETLLPDGVPACVIKYKGSEATMVPLRFVSEALGAQVTWQQETYTADLVRAISTNTQITRVSAQSDAQTVLISTDHAPVYELMDLGGRVVVDVLGAEISSGFPGAITVDNDLITTVRYAQHDNDLYPAYEKTVRVVMDLKKGITLEKNIRAEALPGGILLTTFLTDEDRQDITIPPTGPLDPTKKTIVIDPGHGGARPGAVYEGIKEKDLTLSISRKLGAQLLDRGYNVVMLRKTDVEMGLYDRADIANAIGADLFISVHCNAFENPEIHGSLTYYHPSSKRGERLAKAISVPLSNATGAKDKGIADADFVVLRETKMCAVLVECGFMTNHEELMNLSSSAYQDKIAKGIADGVGVYFKG